MSCPKTVLVIGGTGRLGTAIVQSILDKDSNVKIKIFARHKDEEFLKQHQQRVTFTEGNIDDPNWNFDTMFKNVDAVVSAILGDDQIVVHGQKKMIDAAKKAGVRQFIPSSFSNDYRKAPTGFNPNYDARKEVDEYLKASGIPWTIINQGCFMEVALIPNYMNMINTQERKVYYWGDANTKMQFTTYTDAGKIVAECLWDEWALNRYVCVHGDDVSPQDMSNYMMELCGTAKLEKLGTLDDLSKQIDTHMSQKNIQAALPLIYLLGMMKWSPPTEDCTHFQDKIKFTKFKTAFSGSLEKPEKWVYGPKTMHMHE